MHPKSSCMHYFFVDALTHSTNNVCFYVVRQCIHKKMGACMHYFFVDLCADAFHKSCIFCAGRFFTKVMNSLFASYS